MPILEEMLNSILERMQDVATDVNAPDIETIGGGDAPTNVVDSPLDSLSVLTMDSIMDSVADKLGMADCALDTLEKDPFKEALADFMSFAIIASPAVLGYISKCSGKSIAVLGMKGAGKTLFYRLLQHKEYNADADSNTSEKDYGEFIYKTKKGRKIKIMAGLDIGGQPDMAKKHYNDLINQSDTIFFLFDLHNYLNEKEYLEDTNARLDYISRHVSNKSLYVFCTHMNKIETTKREESLLRFKSLINDKPYSSVVKSVAFVELADPSSFSDIENQLFD